MTGLVDGKGSNELLLSRVNTIREEAGGANRFFISDLNGPLYIFDKATKKFTVYLDFNGSRDKSGIFRKLFITRGYGNGLNGFYLDPDYTRNGKFYTDAHRGSGASRLEPSQQRELPRAERRRLHHDRGDHDTGTSPERGGADPVDRFEPVERDVRGHGARAVPRAAEHDQPPAGRHHLQSGGASRRSGLARALHGVRRWRVGRIEDRRDPGEPAAARQPRGKDPAHHPGSRQPCRHEHGERERPLPHSQRQSVRLHARCAQGDLGLRLPQSASPELGDRSRQPGQQSPDRQLGRHEHVGDGLSRTAKASTTATRGARATSCSRTTIEPARSLPIDRIPLQIGEQPTDKHAGADLSGDSVRPRPEGRRLDRQRLRLQRQGDRRRFAGSTSSPTSRPAASGTPTTKTCWPPTTARPRRWRRSAR